MMKHFSFFAFLVMALASCSSDLDEPGTIDEPVAAKVTAHIGPVSRAAGTSWSADDEIGISGVSGMTAYTNVKYSIADAASGRFTPAGAGIFYQTTADVVFTAYYPFRGSDGTVQASVSDNTRADNQTAAAQPGIDYLWARATGGYKKPINFAFDHKMSRLSLTFTAGDGFENLTKMTAYTVGGLKMEGTFDTATGTTTATGTVEDLTINDMTLTGLILYPQTPDNNGLKISTVVDGKTYSCTLEEITELAAGNEYKMDIKVSKTGLSVTGCTISSWGNGGSFNGNATLQ